jgi:hypothetical protein
MCPSKKKATPEVAFFLLNTMVIREGLEPSTQWLKVLKSSFFVLICFHFSSIYSAFFTIQFRRVYLGFAKFGILGTQ